MNQKLRVITVLTCVLSFWAIGVSAIDLTEGLVGYWPLDGDGTDESGNKNDTELADIKSW